MNSRTSNLVARLVGATLALALPCAAMAQESDAFKAPVHHQDPDAQ